MSPKVQSQVVLFSEYLQTIGTRILLAFETLMEADLVSHELTLTVVSLCALVADVRS